MELGEFLRKLRKRAGLTQVELAQRLGISRSRIARIEAGYVSSPRPDFLVRLAGILGIPVEEVLQAAGYLPKAEERVSVDDFSSLPAGLRALLESAEGKALKIARRELEALAAVGARYGRLSKEAYITILMEIRRE